MHLLAAPAWLPQTLKSRLQHLSSSSYIEEPPTGSKSMSAYKCSCLLGYLKQFISIREIWASIRHCSSLAFKPICCKLTDGCHIWGRWRQSIQVRGPCKALKVWLTAFKYCCLERLLRPGQRKRISAPKNRLSDARLVNAAIGVLPVMRTACSAQVLATTTSKPGSQDSQEPRCIFTLNPNAFNCGQEATQCQEKPVYIGARCAELTWGVAQSLHPASRRCRQHCGPWAR